jgi:hypothetical protein
MCGSVITILAIIAAMQIILSGFLLFHTIPKNSMM